MKLVSNVCNCKGQTVKSISSLFSFFALPPKQEKKKEIQKIHRIIRRHVKTGASGNVHLECLETWMTSSNRDNCEVCLEKIHIEKIPKYGILRSIPIFVYSSKISQIVIFIMLLGILVYVSSVRYTEKLTVQSNSYVRKFFLFAANMCIFCSVFVISYSPLLCLYLWDMWRVWRKTQYTLRVTAFTETV